MFRSLLVFGGVSICLVCATHSLSAAVPYEQDWTRRFGDSRNFKEHASSVAVDSTDDVVVVGRTKGPRQSINRALDVYLTKTDSDGRELWTREIDGNGTERGTSVAIGPDDAIFLTGSGDSNMLLAKVSVAGDVEWMWQFGEQGDYEGTSLALNDFGEIFVTGNSDGNLSGEFLDTADAFLSKHDANGQLVWRTQFGSTGYDQAYGVDVDPAGNAYAVGYTNTGFDNPGAGSAFVSKFSDGGEMLWTRRIGSNQARAYATAVDDTGQVYVVGNTGGGFGFPAAGGADAFIAKLDETGELLWANQFATPAHDFALTVALGKDAAYLGGFTHGPSNFSSTAQSLIVKYDLGGTELWRHIFGPNNADRVTDLAVDSHGDLFASGRLESGVFDGILLKFDNPIPEPSSAMLTAMACGMIGASRRRKDRIFSFCDKRH